VLVVDDDPTVSDVVRRYLEQDGFEVRLAADGLAALADVNAAPPGLDTDAVITTNTASTRRGVEHLIGRGHRRIAYLGHPASGYGAPKRWLGYCQALRGAGIPVDPDLVRRGLTSDAEALAATTELLSLADPPTALFADNNRLTLGALQSPAYARTPVEIVGFDHFDLAAQLSVSVIDSDPYQVGNVGAELLFKRLADRDRPPTHASVRAHLIVNDAPTFAPIRPAPTRPPLR
jgi:LacI family transcriptional regulator